MPVFLFRTVLNTGQEEKRSPRYSERIRDGPVVRTVCFHCPGHRRVQSLVRELRSHTPSRALLRWPLPGTALAEALEFPGVSKGSCLPAKSFQSSPTPCDPVNCSLPGSSVHEISQTAILEWVAISSFRGSSRARDQTRVLSVLH